METPDYCSRYPQTTPNQQLEGTHFRYLVCDCRTKLLRYNESLIMVLGVGGLYHP